MNYQLCANILKEGCTDKVKQLIHEYSEYHKMILGYEELAMSLTKELSILQAENKFLKEDLDNV